MSVIDELIKRPTLKPAVDSLIEHSTKPHVTRQMLMLLLDVAYSHGRAEGMKIMSPKGEEDGRRG